MAETTIERMGERGDGLAQGKAFPRTLPGEKLDSSRHVLQISAERVPPLCPVFETCGGCKLQHWQIEPYHRWKTSLLVEALAAKGIVTKINPLIDAHGHGRRRVSLHLREANGIWRAGFMAEGSHVLVPIDHCPVLVPKLHDAPRIAAYFGTFFGACDVAITATDNGLDIAIKANRKLADKALAQFDSFMRQNAVTRIALNGQILSQLAPPLMQMGKAQVSLPIGGFLQATTLGEETLVNLSAHHLKKSRRILDLFCGVGPFALRLSEKMAVHGVDLEKPAVAALQAAVRMALGLKPVTAEVLDLFHNPMTPAELNEFDGVVLDPPRAGGEAQCRNLAKSKIKRIAYVSCDVQSLARDAAILITGGYRLVEATPVDQFKYSPHLETVALFTRQ